jgi:prolyl 4-hydroxylase
MLSLPTMNDGELNDAADGPLDRYCDPKTLAYVGMMVRQRLSSMPGVERVDVADADMFIVPGFLTRRDCKAIAQVINSRAVPSTLYRGTERPGFRTSFTHHFDRDDPLTVDVEAYISELIGIDNDYSEAMQGQRYQVGQEFRHHYDFFPTGEGYWQHEAVRGGQRTWTAMVSLTEPKEGGETDFPHLGIALRQQAGTLVIWNNMDAEGRPNMKTLHAGMPVKRGVKHIITKWYRQEPWRILNPVNPSSY